MKKIYLSIIASALIVTANAQLSLTQAFNEPIIGDVNLNKPYDTAGVVPKNTGAGQIWDFSSLLTNTVVAESVTFKVVGSSGPNSSIYTGATLADYDGGSFYTYYKSTSGMFENLGFEDANIILKFTNTAIVATYPISMGYNFSDVAAGTCTAIVLANATGTVNGVSNVMGTGTGTLMIPGGAVFTNVLQTISTASINIFCPTTIIGPFTMNNEGITYSYYAGSQKFPILTVEYVTVTGNFPSTTATVKLNTSVVTGINNANLDASFNIFPNPAKDQINLKLHNETNVNGTIEIINSLGQVAQTTDLGNDTEIRKNVFISGLSSGIYMVRTTLGSKVSVRKLIIE